MRLFEMTDDVWFHGSPKLFQSFDATAKPINRGSNPTGVYLTKNIKLAQRYAGDTGYVYKVIPYVNNTFIDKVTEVNDNLAKSYREALYKHTTYQYDWIDTALIPEMFRTNRIKSDVSGEVKTETYVGAGYDSYKFMDMFDISLVVFDPSNVKIVGQYNSAQSLPSEEI